MSSIRSITRIEPGQFALIMGVTYLLIGIIIGVLMYLFTSMIPMPTPLGSTARGIGVIFIPIIYGVIGYICGYIGAAIYNLVAGTVGGIKVTVSE